MKEMGGSMNPRGLEIIHAGKNEEQVSEAIANTRLLSHIQLAKQGQCIPKTMFFPCLVPAELQEKHEKSLAIPAR